jgi:hypothetical protein
MFTECFQVSFGLLGYEMDRTQSIMRIATTASPVSGMDVRDKILQLSLDRKRHKMFDNCQKVGVFSFLMPTRCFS